MPRFRSFRFVVLVWLCLAWWFLVCFQAISLAACSNSSILATPFNHQLRTTALTAKRIWQIVNSGIFLPLLEKNFCQEEETDRTQDQMPLQPRVTAAFIVIQSHLAFEVFETTLDSTARESD